MTFTDEQGQQPTAVSRGGQAEGRKGAQAIERVLDIMEAFTAEEPELTITQLSQRLGLHKTTVHRLASTLMARGLLARDPRTRAYMLGHGLLRFVELVLNRQDIVSVSMPHMTRLRAVTGETIGLHVRVGSERVCIAQLESTQEMRMRLDIGRPLPLYCGASSKVFLAEMQPAEVEAVVRETGLKPLGPGSITDRRALGNDLQSIRKRGYAISRAERIAGGATVAAPIRDESGALVASLSIYAPLMRADDKRIEKWIPLIKEAAGRISAELGFPEKSHGAAVKKNQGAVTAGRRGSEGRRKDRAPQGRGGVS